MDDQNVFALNFYLRRLPLHQFLPHCVATVLSYSSQSRWTIKTSSLYLMVFLLKKGFRQRILRLLTRDADVVQLLRQS